MSDGRIFTWTTGAEIQPVRVEWWEKHLIPKGVLTLPVGRGNSGKSTTCAAWAAEATRRGELVVWLHSEEDRSMHIVPKMLAAGANVDLIRFLDVGVQMEDGDISEATLQLPRDLDRLEADLVEMGCRFIVFDALTSFKPSRMSANSGDDVRAFLEPIQRMAGRLNAVVLGIAHLGKDGERKARDAVKGASEWTDVPRQVLAFHRNDEETEGVISDVKGNLSPSPRSIGYRFESVSLPEHGIDEVGRVVFTGDVDTNVDEARRSASPDDDGDDRKESEIWLEDYLTEKSRGGEPEVDSTVAKRDGAKALGVGVKTIQRAAAAINVVKTQKGFPRKVFWSLATIVDGEVVSVDSEDTNDPPVTQTVSTLVHTGDEQAKHSAVTDVHTGENPSVDTTQNSVPTGCPHCDDPLIYADDLADGFHTSKTKCVAAQKRAAPSKGSVITMPKRCENCYVDLPKTVSGTLCDDCDDGSGGVMTWTTIKPEVRGPDDWRQPQYRGAMAALRRDIANAERQQPIGGALPRHGEESA
ncbi:AAA family ATPase [Gordonia sp. CPCC 205333]|uniref:AAA family ATPase n=1 Tax=Gordonia sp. CPCC 205333 TaxID=3140790 RepID=UPI003AF3A067